MPVGAKPRSRVVRGGALCRSPTHTVACAYVSGHPWEGAGRGLAASCLPWGQAYSPGDHLGHQSWGGLFGGMGGGPPSGLLPP